MKHVRQKRHRPTEWMGSGMSDSTRRLDLKPKHHVSVPGRTEVAGNHQDHQGGCVIAASIDMRTHCEASLTDGSKIHVLTDGIEDFSIDLSEKKCWTPKKDERHTTISLVRGMAAQLIQHGVEVKGCVLDFHSDIPIGLGLSSSAAYELCVGGALLAVSGWNLASVHEEMAPYEMQEAKRISTLNLAQMALHAERAFFGKPCGIMDQIVCAYGGVIYMDFHNRVSPELTPFTLPRSCKDYTYFLIDCGRGHENDTDDFAQVALDMQSAASVFDVAQLRDITMDDYLKGIDRVRDAHGDMVALRGLAFFEEYDLVNKRFLALRNDDLPGFIRLSRYSSSVSVEMLQNVGFPGKHEGAMVTLALCQVLLEEYSKNSSLPYGSARIHGGGFGGTVQVIVPNDIFEEFEERIDDLLGYDACLNVNLGTPGILIDA